ncbi:TlyA family RNA methyltransferase [Brevibacterium yomogidense]|uniref:TlyA family RNA methyltransferase n=1 Tax=Brevibacterium yomogidense TaxID=946573 RepID=UPI0018DFA002
MPSGRVRTAGRLDTVLTELGLVSSRNRAAREIRAARVTVDGATVTRPSTPVPPGTMVEVAQPERWVARSAHKLLGALEDLGLTSVAQDAVCLDAGASTGGFTQVLLDHGAAAVHAVDVGHDQLVERIAEDPRVHDLPGTNVRTLTRAQLMSSSLSPFHPDGTVDLVVADLSFISLTLVVDALLGVARDGAPLLLMVKPQFELDRAALDKHGVVTDPADRDRALIRVTHALAAAGARVRTTMQSRLPGPAGNLEHFVLAEAVAVNAPASAKAARRAVASATVERGTPPTCGAAPVPAPASEDDP